MKKLKTILRSRYLFKILALLTIIFSVIYVNFVPKESNLNQFDNNFVGIITNYKIDGNKLTIELKSKEKTIINYYLKTKKEKQEYERKLELGSTIRVEGTLILPTTNTVPNTFNYKRYLNLNKIYYTITALKITKIKNNTNILYGLKNQLLNRMNKIDKTGYLNLFILGDKQIVDSDTLNAYQKNGISHLFSISGMHINLLVGVLLFILNKVSYNLTYKYLIIIVILLLYMFLTNFSASIVRTTIMVILVSINKVLCLKIKKIDIMLLTLIIAIITNPYILYGMGFQFSYIISFSLVLLNKKINNTRGIKKNLYLSFICFIVSFPLSIYYFNQVNVLSIILNLFMIPFVSTIVFPMTIITFIFPNIMPIYLVVIKVLEMMNSLFANINILEIVFLKPSLLIVFLYYAVIYISFFKTKYLIIFFLFLIIHKTYPNLNSNIIITMIDVGQGDSLFLKLPYNKANILIDTGGRINYTKEKWMIKKKQFSYTGNKTIPYLKSLGIMKLNYLIITHGDYDHMGEAINLVENFKVEKVIFNCGEFNDLENELIKVLDKKKIPYYSCIKELNIDNNKLYFLNNKDYGNENDNSSVIYTELNNYKFLFMGDAGVEAEEDLIEKYNLQDIDVLKVGHHGSKTSSSKNFIDEINPKYSIISVGKNNRYGHPNENVLENLENSIIYRTDKAGSIIFKIKNNKLKIKTVIHIINN